MIIEFALAWWHIPSGISLAVLLWAFFWPSNDTSSYAGVGGRLIPIPILAIIALVWIVAGIFK